jgi:hypothetical protein
LVSVAVGVESRQCLADVRSHRRGCLVLASCTDLRAVLQRECIGIGHVQAERLLLNGLAQHAGGVLLRVWLQYRVVAPVATEGHGAVGLGAQQEAFGLVVVVQQLEAVVEQWQQVLRRGQDRRCQVYLVVILILARVTAAVDARACTTDSTRRQE